jgi:hypothetical protein
VPVFDKIIPLPHVNTTPSTASPTIEPTFVSQSTPSSVPNKTSSIPTSSLTSNHSSSLSSVSSVTASLAMSTTIHSSLLGDSSVEIKPTKSPSELSTIQQPSAPDQTVINQEEQEDGDDQHQSTTPKSGGISATSIEDINNLEQDPENGGGQRTSNDTMHKPNGQGQIQTDNKQIGANEVSPDLIGGHIIEDDQQDSEKTNVDIGAQRPDSETEFQGNNSLQSGDDKNTEQDGTNNTQINVGSSGIIGHNDSITQTILNDKMDNHDTTDGSIVQNTHTSKIPSSEEAQNPVHIEGNNLTDVINDIFSTIQENGDSIMDGNTNVIINLPSFGGNIGQEDSYSEWELFSNSSETDVNVTSSSQGVKSTLINYMPSLKWLFVFIDN